MYDALLFLASVRLSFADFLLMVDRSSRSTKRLLGAIFHLTVSEAVQPTFNPYHAQLRSDRHLRPAMPGCYPSDPLVRLSP
jgi:hypothetical protein